jgi:hypothetical protein
MAEGDKPKRRTRARETAAAGGEKTQEAKSRRAPRKQASPAARKAGPAPRAASRGRRTSAKEGAEAKAAAQAAAEAAARQERAERVEALRATSQAVAASSQEDMAAGIEAIATAEAVAELSRALGEAGIEEILAGRRVLRVSQDVASESLAVRALSEEDLNIGLALAGIAGQLRSLTGAVDRLGPRVIAGVLESKGEQLGRLAESVMARSAATAALGRTLAQTSLAAAQLGDAEVAEGQARLTVSEWEAEESQDLAGEGVGLMAWGITEAVAADDLREQAEEIGSSEPPAPASSPA